VGVLLLIRYVSATLHQTFASNFLGVSSRASFRFTASVAIGNIFIVLFIEDKHSWLKFNALCFGGQFGVGGSAAEGTSKPKGWADIRSSPGGIEPVRRSDVILAGIDFHVRPKMFDGVHRWYASFVILRERLISRSWSADAFVYCVQAWCSGSCSSRFWERFNRRRITC